MGNATDCDKQMKGLSQLPEDVRIYDVRVRNTCRRGRYWRKTRFSCMTDIIGMPLTNQRINGTTAAREALIGVHVVKVVERGRWTSSCNGKESRRTLLFLTEFRPHISLL